MEWITKKDLESYVGEYGIHSYDAILYTHKDGYLQLDVSHEGAIENSDEYTMFCIVIEPEGKE